jgi:hypothetical protein
MSSAIRCNWQLPAHQGVQLSNLTLPIHASATLWLEPDKVSGTNIEWVNKSFWDMRTRGWWLAQQGMDVSDIMGETCPTLRSDSTPPTANEESTKFWTVSRWASRFVDSFPHLSMADRLACWIAMFVTFQVSSIRSLVSESILADPMFSGKSVRTRIITVQFPIGIDLFQSSIFTRTWRA